MRMPQKLTNTLSIRLQIAVEKLKQYTTKIWRLRRRRGSATSVT